MCHPRCSKTQPLSQCGNARKGQRTAGGEENDRNHITRCPFETTPRPAPCCHTTRRTGQCFTFADFEKCRHAQRGCPERVSVPVDVSAIGSLAAVAPTVSAAEATRLDYGETMTGERQGRKHERFAAKKLRLDPETAPKLTMSPPKVWYESRPILSHSTSCTPRRIFVVHHEEDLLYNSQTRKKYTPYGVLHCVIHTVYFTACLVRCRESPNTCVYGGEHVLVGASTQVECLDAGNGVTDGAA